MPALLTRMSKPPSCVDGRGDRRLPARLVGDVEVRERAVRAALGDRARPSPRRGRRGCRRSSPTAPASASAWAMPAPKPAGTAGDQRPLAGQIHCGHRAASAFDDRGQSVTTGCDVDHNVGARLGQVSRFSWTLVQSSHQTSLELSTRSRLGAWMEIDRGQRLTVRRPRSPQRQVDKFAERRDELADAALQTLAELGYARTSLREIAQNSDVLPRRAALLLQRQGRADHPLRASSTRPRACSATTRSSPTRHDRRRSWPTGSPQAWPRPLATTPPLHRLWYDLRSQSMFEAAFRVDVARDRRQPGADDLAGRRPATPSWRGTTLTVTPATAYAMFDGLFQQALLRHLAGSTDALVTLAQQIRLLLPTLVEPRPASDPDA